MKIRALLVGHDDTKTDLLVSLIKTSATDIDIVAVESDVLAGIKAITVHLPDLVFFDIQPTSQHSLELLELLDIFNFELIVTAADTTFAELALKAGASGYLVYPIAEKMLNSTLEKVVRTMRHKQQESEVSDGKSYSFNKADGTVVLPSVGGFYKVSLNEILYIEAKGRQVEIVIESGKKTLINLNLKTILKVFDKSIFIRIHKSFIVNFIHIKRFRKGKDSSITLYNDTILNVGKVYKEGLSQIIDHLPK